eukprot:m.171450 g.171450  ORF g.171450 m.171450 type:complete len:215 (-) comp17841_c0_seq4:187-831(-)
MLRGRRGGSAFNTMWGFVYKGIIAWTFALRLLHHDPTRHDSVWTPSPRYIAGYDSAAFWDNGDGMGFPSPPPSDSHTGHFLVDSSAHFRFNPVHFGLELLAQSANHTMLVMKTTEQRVHGFAAWAGDKLLVYLINKLAGPAQVSVDIAGLSGAEACSAATAGVDSVVDTADHWGTLASAPLACASKESSAAVHCRCNVTLAPLTFNLVSLTWGG